MSNPNVSKVVHGANDLCDGYSMLSNSHKRTGRPIFTVEMPFSLARRSR
jgi:hypothetical protein